MKKFKIILLFISILAFSSCSGQRIDHIPETIHNNDVVSVATELAVYNDVVNDLIKNRFYAHYLGDAADRLYANYGATPDTSAFNAEQRKLTINLLNNPANLCTLYLNEDTAARREFDWKLKFTTSYGQKIEKILNKYSKNTPEVVSKLTTRQELYSANNFHSTIAKIMAVHTMKDYDMDTRTIRNQQDKCVIGAVSISNIILDKTKQKGILYYEFYCGGKCGKGELVEIEKIKGKWKTVRTEMFWTS